MSPASQADPDPSQEYHGLADKQQRIVDLKARNPEWSNRKVAEEVPANESYTSTVLNEYQHIVEARRRQFFVQEEEAEAETSDPFDCEIPVEEDIQTIDERPAAEGSAVESVAPEYDVEFDEKLTVEFSKGQIMEILERGELPDSLYQQIVWEVMRRAFGGDQ